MTVGDIDHVNIDTDKPEETITFYQQVLGLEHRPEDRPGDRSTGAWMFSGDNAVVHLNFHAPDSETAAALALRHRSAVNHVAFLGDDFDGTCASLDRLGVTYRTNEIPSIDLKQIFVTDPNDVMIEINIRN